MSGDYILCGMRVRSELPLPELLPWRGGDRPPDVEISFGSIEEPAGPPIFTRPFSRLWGGGAYLLELSGVGRFFVEAGRKILLEPASGAQESELGLFVLSTCLAVLCHQRGLYPLHASSVRVDGGAVLFAGDTGRGKSALSAVLDAHGYPLLSDDVSVVDPSGPHLLPTFPQFKLSPDVGEALGLQQDGMQSTRPGTIKLRVPARGDFDSAPVPLLAIYIFGWGMSDKIGEITRLPPALALAQLTAQLYRRASGVRIQSEPALFKSTSMIAQTVPIYLLPVGSGPLSSLGMLAERVVTHFKAKEKS